MTAATLEEWAGLPYADLAFEVLRLYIPVEEIPDADLRRLVTKSYATFRHADVVPVIEVGRARACVCGVRGVPLLRLGFGVCHCVLLLSRRRRWFCRPCPSFENRVADFVVASFDCASVVLC